MELVRTRSETKVIASQRARSSRYEGNEATQAFENAFAATQRNPVERMDQVVAKLNIAHYQRLLVTDLDAIKRTTVEKLLAAEEVTLAGLKEAARLAKQG